MSESTTLTAPPKTKAPEKPKTDTLTLRDRCDGCSAAAYVHVFLTDGGELMFCGHHFQKHEVALFSYIDHDKTVDERHKLVTDRLKGSENS